MLIGGFMERMHLVAVKCFMRRMTWCSFVEELTKWKSSDIMVMLIDSFMELMHLMAEKYFIRRWKKWKCGSESGCYLIKTA